MGFTNRKLVRFKKRFLNRDQYFILFVCKPKQISQKSADREQNLKNARLKIFIKNT